MDKEFLKKHNLMEAHNHFMHLAEGYFSGIMNEADDDQQPPQDDPNAQGGQPPMGDPNAQGGMPPGDAPQGPGMIGGAPNGQQPPMGGPDAQGGQPPMGDDMPPMEGPGNGPMMDKPDEPKDIINVEDITSAQEKLNKKENSIGKDLGNVSDTITKVLTAVETLKSAIDKNSQDILNLNRELTKRMPTDTERLNMQSLKSYPFNISPMDYFKKVEADGHYKATEDEPEEKLIKRQDINDYNPTQIEDSFEDDNDEMNQTMRSIFRGF